MDKALHSLFNYRALSSVQGDAKALSKILWQDARLLEFMILSFPILCMLYKITTSESIKQQFKGVQKMKQLVKVINLQCCSLEVAEGSSF